jgi:glycosyltransferase involved in cell wall biosynthesis
MLNRMNVRSVFQPVAGCGPARQLGQEHARGKYVLMADGDCFYPPQWIEKMTLALMKPGVSCVYGRYSFLGTETISRWKFFIYERLRDAMANVRHIKRPCLNALGMSMGYVKELGLKGGFIDKKIRGEDGRMCLYLMQYGKVTQVKNANVRVWTLPRTLDKESGLWYSLVARIVVELSRIKDYFSRQDPSESTKATSYNPKVLTHFKKFKEVHKEEKIA